MDKEWTDQDIIEADTEMSGRKIPFHARSFHLGQILCKGRFVNSRTYTEEMARDYKRLFPEYSNIWTGTGTGFINSLDRVKKITLPWIAGTHHLAVHDLCGFGSHEELVVFCRGREDLYNYVVNQALMVFKINNLVINETTHKRSALLWDKCKAYLNAISDNLENSYFVGFSNSETWLLFEFAAKSLLASAGATDDDLKKVGHFKKPALKALKNIIKDTSKIAKLESVLKELPDYNSSRYDPIQLSRIEVIAQASAAQLGAAICASSFRGQSQQMQMTMPT